MTAVKTLVAVMTLLLLLGLGLLAYGMAQQSSKLGRSEGDVTIPRVDDPPMTFNSVALDEPAGSAIVATMADGRGRMLVTITGGGRPDRVVVVDMVEGRRLGVVTVGGGERDAPSSRQ